MFERNLRDRYPNEQEKQDEISVRMRVGSLGRAPVFHVAAKPAEAVRFVTVADLRRAADGRGARSSWTKARSVPGRVRRALDAKLSVYRSAPNGVRIRGAGRGSCAYVVPIGRRPFRSCMDSGGLRERRPAE